MSNFFVWLAREASLLFSLDPDVALATKAFGPEEVEYTVSQAGHPAVELDAVSADGLDIIERFDSEELHQVRG